MVIFDFKIKKNLKWLRFVVCEGKNRVLPSVLSHVARSVDSSRAVTSIKVLFCSDCYMVNWTVGVPLSL